ncbi:hypothetical protein AAMO2058_000793500 [Amorphochlora amoebiformis]
MITNTTFALNAEIQRFQQEIKDFSSTITSEADETAKSLRSSLSKNKELKKRLEAKESELKFNLVDKNKAISSVLSRVRTLQAKKQELESLMKSLPKELGNIRADRRKNLDEIASYEKELSLLEEDDTKSSEDIRELCAMYRDTLGLEIYRFEGGEVQFDFRYIDPEQPENIFSFRICVDKNRRYQVPYCQPRPSNLEDLVAELQSRDKLRSAGIFPWFVQRMRREFRKMAVEKKDEKTSPASLSYIA